MPTQNHYQILKVTPKTSLREIKTSYYHLAKEWHPDKNPTDKINAEEQFKKITAAYECLSDPTQREQFDAELDAELKKAKPSTPFANEFNKEEAIIIEKATQTDLFDLIKKNISSEDKVTRFKMIISGIPPSLEQSSPQSKSVNATALNPHIASHSRHHFNLNFTDIPGGYTLFDYVTHSFKDGLSLTERRAFAQQHPAYYQDVGIAELLLEFGYQAAPRHANAIMQTLYNADKLESFFANPDRYPNLHRIIQQYGFEWKHHYIDSLLNSYLPSEQYMYLEDNNQVPNTPFSYLLARFFQTDSSENANLKREVNKLFEVAKANDTLNHQMSNGETLLQYIVGGNRGPSPNNQSEKIALTQQFLEAGASPNQTDNFGNNALHIYCKSKSNTLEMAQLLIQYQVELNAQNDGGLTPLHISISSLDDTKVNFLLRQPGIKPNLQDAKGATLLHYAVNNFKNELGHSRFNNYNDVETATDLIKKLLTKEIDYKIKDNAGKTAIDYAMEHEQKTLLHIFLQHAIKNNDEETIQKLANNKQTRDVLFYHDNKDRNALIYAQDKNSSASIISYLKKQGIPDQPPMKKNTSQEFLLDEVQKLKNMITQFTTKYLSSPITPHRGLGSLEKAKQIINNLPSSTLSSDDLTKELKSSIRQLQDLELGCLQEKYHLRNTPEDLNYWHRQVRFWGGQRVTINYFDPKQKQMTTAVPSGIAEAYKISNNPKLTNAEKLSELSQLNFTHSTRHSRFTLFALRFTRTSITQKGYEDLKDVGKLLKL